MITSKVSATPSVLRIRNGQKEGLEDLIECERPQMNNIECTGNT